LSTAKEEVRELLDNLPDDCSPGDVQYHPIRLRCIVARELGR